MSVQIQRWKALTFLIRLGTRSLNRDLARTLAASTGIRRRKSRPNNHSRKHNSLKNQIRKQRRDHPAKRHHRPQHNSHALPMPMEIKLWEFNADSKALHPDNDTRDLLQDVVIEVLDARRDDVQHCGPEDDAAEHGERRLREV